MSEIQSAALLPGVVFDPTYRTSDGQSFPTPEAAQYHQALINVSNAGGAVINGYNAGLQPVEGSDEVPNVGLVLVGLRDEVFALLTAVDIAGQYVVKPKKGRGRKATTASAASVSSAPVSTPAAVPAAQPAASGPAKTKGRQKGMKKGPDGKFYFPADMPAGAPPATVKTPKAPKAAKPAKAPKSGKSTAEGGAGRPAGLVKGDDGHWYKDGVRYVTKAEQKALDKAGAKAGKTAPAAKAAPVAAQPAAPAQVTNFAPAVVASPVAPARPSGMPFAIAPNGPQLPPPQSRPPMPASAFATA